MLAMRQRCLPAAAEVLLIMAVPSFCSSGLVLDRGTCLAHDAPDRLLGESLRASDPGRWLGSERALRNRCDPASARGRVIAGLAAVAHDVRTGGSGS